MKREKRSLAGCWTAVLLFGAGILFFSPPMAAGGCADPARDIGASQFLGNKLLVAVEGLDLVCRPALIHDREGNWTFYLSGSDVLRIVRADLVLGSKRYAARNLAFPTPHALLLDYTYDPVTVDTPAHLELFVKGAATAVRVPLAVAPGLAVPPEHRQKWLVRAQIRKGDVEYILHGMKPRDPIKERSLDEFPCRPDLLEDLRGIEIDRIRKVMPRYAEDDSIQWDARYLRQLHYHGTQLRQYIMHIKEGRSEAAYKEIMLSLPGVEKAFINEDKAKSRGKKGKKRK